MFLEDYFFKNSTAWRSWKGGRFLERFFATEFYGVAQSRKIEQLFPIYIWDAA